MSSSGAANTRRWLRREECIKRAQRLGFVLAQRPIIVENAHPQFVACLDEAQPAQVARPEVGGHIVAKLAHSSSLPQATA